MTRAWFAPSNISAIYVLVLAIIVFGVLAPNTFLTVATAKSILNASAIASLAALSLVLPLSAGVFDLSIGGTMSLASIVTGWCLEFTGMNPVFTVLAGLGTALTVGIINAIIVVNFNINSFIATLATGGMVAAFALSVSNSAVLNVRLNSLRGIGTVNWNGITVPVFLALGVSVIIAVFLNRTPMGRLLYATGFDKEAARTVGIPTGRLQAMSLVTSSLVAGFAGIVLTARVEAADPTAGGAYLIPAFSAAFLGSTQFKRGRFNAWGTIVAVLLLNCGSTGFVLKGWPTWTVAFFDGIVLIAAVGLALRERSGGPRFRGRLPSGNADSSSS
jgi:ribose transport system permease protein